MKVCIKCGKDFEKRQSLAAHIGHCGKHDTDAYIARKAKMLHGAKMGGATTATMRHAPIVAEREKERLCEQCGRVFIDPLFTRNRTGRFCGKTCANKYSSSYNKAAATLKVKATWRAKVNSGVLYERPLLQMECKQCGTSFESKVAKRKFCTRSCAIKFNWTDPDSRQRMIAGCRGNLSGKKGGIRDSSGFAKKFKYSSPIAGEVILQGSYELAYAKYLDANGIKWTKNKIGFPYEFEGRGHLYYPDFHLVGSDEYIETKGFVRPSDHAKWSQFPKQLRVLMRKDLLEMGLSV